MKHDPTDDRRPGEARRQLEEFFRDERRLALAEAPGFDELAAYVEGRLDPEARALLEERLAADAVLSQEVDDLRALHAQMAGPARPAARPFPLRLAPWLAAAAALAALVFWLRPTQRGPDVAGASPSAPAPVATLADGGRHVALFADGRVGGLPPLDGRTQSAVAAALRGSLPAPAGLLPLRSGPGTLMGSAPPAAFAPLAPLATRVGSLRPTFRWSAHPLAHTYEVAVFDQELRRQLGSGVVAGTEWTPATPLRRGRTYLWQVTALTGRGRVTAPAPPAPEARFEVAAPAVLAEVEGRRAAAPASHLVAVVAFVEAGLLDDAGGELGALEAENPGSPEVARLRAALLALRSAKPPR